MGVVLVGDGSPRRGRTGRGAGDRGVVGVGGMTTGDERRFLFVFFFPFNCGCCEVFTGAAYLQWVRT